MAILLFAALLPAAGALRALSADANVELKTRPVMKVIRLLQDMQAELQTDLDDDKAVHELLTCWCNTNEKEKTKAIELGEAKEASLESFLGEAAAKIKELQAKSDATLDEVDRDYNALKEAQALRMKENQAFHAEEMNLMEASKACQQALVALGKHSSAMPDLVQVKAAAQHLQKANVLSLGVLSPSKLQALKEFLGQAQGATAFLAIPGMQSYAPQSGQIFGILEQMKEDFDKDLVDEKAKEKKAVEEFTLLKEAKEEEIASGRKLVAELDEEIADTKEKHAQAFKELEATQKQLGLDTTFLANLQKKCAASNAEFDQRVKDRLAEIAAVEDTIKILNDDKAFENFDTTVNSFVQVSKASSQEKIVRQQAVDVLKKAAAKSHSMTLSLIASKVKLDAFTKVKAEIDKMVAELKTQQEDEIAHRDWCIDELNKNNRSQTAAYDKKASLETKIANLKKTIEYLTKEIEETTAAVAEAQNQMKRASENREAENADFQQTIVDQRLTQQILDKALARMKQVYAFLEQPGGPHIATSGTHTDPGNGPARFSNYETNKGGSKVVSMIEEVIADSHKTEDEAMASEEDSQTAYEQFMKESNDSITSMTKKLNEMSGARAKAKEDLTMAEDDLRSTVGLLEELHNTNGDLHKSCDFVMDNFDARQEARAAEIDALGEAKAILSGAQ